MLVQCPQCKTKYKVSDDVVKGAAPAFRCSRCKYTFELEPSELPEPSPEETPLPDADKAAEQELSFTFPSQEKENSQAQAENIAAPFASETHAGFTSNTESPDSWSINAGAAKEEEPFTISEPLQPAKEEKISDAPEHASAEQLDDLTFPPSREATANVYAIAPYREQRASIVPFLTLFVLLIIFFSFATAYHLVHPQSSEGIVGKIPLVGSSVLKNNHLKNGVLLQSLQANYQTIQGNREIFVVTGTALNQNPVVIREVRVAGKLYNQEGKEIEQQTIWIGNAISPKIVRGMTVQDISDLQRLKPLKSFEIPPGDSVPFTIVFLKPTKAAKDFRCEIMSAEGEA